MRVPIRLSARAISGIGDVAGTMLANPRIEGWLSITPKTVRGDGLRLTSAKWNGKLSVLIDLVTGRFQVLVSGAMQRYQIPGLGIVDVITDLKVVPGPGGKGSLVVGTAKAWVRRLDNSFFRELTGGLPRLETSLTRGNDGIVRFTGLQVYSPRLRLSGSGQRFRDGTFHIVAAQADARRADRAAPARHTARPSERGARASRDAAAAAANARRFRLSRQRRFQARAVHQQRSDPAAEGRANRDLDCLAQRRGSAR
jgi:translocation and assembly module TamB